MKGNRFRICTFPYDYSTGFDFLKEAFMTLRVTHENENKSA